MNIITTDVVASRYDVFWQDLNSPLNNVAHKPVLLLVADCPVGSVESVQLQKMIEVCKIAQDDLCIVRVAGAEQMAWHKLREKINPQKVFLIGVKPEQLGIAALFRLNEPNRFDGRIWLATASIQELEKNQELKRDLWNKGMRPVFIGNP